MFETMITVLKITECDGQIPSSNEGLSSFNPCFHESPFLEFDILYSGIVYYQFQTLCLLDLLFKTAS